MSELTIATTGFLSATSWGRVRIPWGLQAGTGARLLHVQYSSSGDNWVVGLSTDPTIDVTGLNDTEIVSDRRLFGVYVCPSADAARPSAGIPLWGPIVAQDLVMVVLNGSGSSISVRAEISWDPVQISDASWAQLRQGAGRTR